MFSSNPTVALLAVGGLLTGLAGEACAMTQGNMAADRRGEVSGQYGTKPIYVKTGKIVTAKDGTLSIGGTVDTGNNGIKKFVCRFDAKGNFIDVMPVTSDGE